MSYAEHPVRWASDRARAPVQDVSVDHGRADVVVAQELLDPPDVVTILQAVGGERRLPSQRDGGAALALVRANTASFEQKRARDEHTP